jgi:hypothetical protein
MFEWEGIVSGPAPTVSIFIILAAERKIARRLGENVGSVIFHLVCCNQHDRTVAEKRLAMAGSIIVGWDAAMFLV